MVKGSIHQGDNKNYKYIHTQHQSTKIHEEYIDRIEGQIDSNTIGNFNTPLSIMYPDRRSIRKQSTLTTQ